MTAPLRRPLAAAAVAALALTVTGCDRDSLSAASPSSSASAPAAGDPSDGATPSSTETTPTAEPTPDASGPVKLSAADFARLADAALDDTMGARLAIDNGLALLTGTGTIDLREQQTSLGMTLTSTETGDDQKISVVVQGSTLYIADGTRWLSVDIDSASNPFGGSFSEQLDPRAVLDAVQAHLVSATSRGTVERDGDTLEAYRAVADGPTLVQQLAPDLASQEDAVVPARVTCDLTVDPDGHARTIVLDLGEDNGQLSYTLTDWGDGSDLTVSTPPAGQVDELPSLPGG